MMSEPDQRTVVIAIARTWIGTPYHHGARIRRIGADCATFLAAVFEEAGLVQPVTLPAYLPQWHQNGHEELYLDLVREHCCEVEAPRPGDIVMWRFGHVLSHGAIVVTWPRIIHALVDVGVHEDDALANKRLCIVGAAEIGAGKPRERRFFSYWAGR
jgi:cell wall-associated NlpC family hydrolase